MANILYISHTGMTEALGRSQVLEYLMDLSKENKICLISFEREHDLVLIDEVKALVAQNDIEWHFLIYSNKYGVLSTVRQIVKTILLGSKLIKVNSVNIIHSRSMVAALIGIILKKFYGIKLLFDIRGFAMDEKVDCGRLKKKSFLYKILKKIDNYLYKKSDHVVTLTRAAKQVLTSSLQIDYNRITIISTCANNQIFKTMPELEKSKFKNELGFCKENKIIIHTGTVINRYDFDKEVELFKRINSLDSSYKFLILNQGEHKYIKNKFTEYNVSSDLYKIFKSKFTEVYKYLNISDFSLFFIPPTFAKLAMAPTKFAENVICHLPSISNIGVGDMKEHVDNYDVGILIDLKKLNIEELANRIVATSKQNYIASEFDKLFHDKFDKNKAVQKYNEIYNILSE